MSLGLRAQAWPTCIRRTKRWSAQRLRPLWRALSSSQSNASTGLIFSWGDIPSAVPKADRDRILDEDSRLYTDVKAPDREREFVRENMVLELSADVFLDEDVSAGIWEDLEKHKPPQKCKTLEPEITEEEESLASSIDTSGDDAEPEHLVDIHSIETCKLATGKSKKAWVHVVGPADDGLGERWTLSCNINLWRSTSSHGDLGTMKKNREAFLPTCTTLWPLHIKQSITVATSLKKLRCA